MPVQVEAMTVRVIDWAMQAHGGFSVSDDFPLARTYAGQRTLRIFDGPDEVHRQTVAQLELAAQRSARSAVADISRVRQSAADSA
jgi:acyl-CoA dehydrogenase